MSRNDSLAFVDMTTLLNQINCLKMYSCTLAGVAQWTECQPANQRVTGLIPNLGHICLGCGPGPK